MQPQGLLVQASHHPSSSFSSRLVSLAFTRASPYMGILPQYSHKTSFSLLQLARSSPFHNSIQSFSSPYSSVSQKLLLRALIAHPHLAIFIIIRTGAPSHQVHILLLLLLLQLLLALLLDLVLVHKLLFYQYFIYLFYFVLFYYFSIIVLYFTFQFRSQFVIKPIKNEIDLFCELNSERGVPVGHLGPL